MSTMTGEKVLNVAENSAFVAKAADPLTFNVVTPADFAAQFPTPLDPTEVIAMCEEVNLLNAIPEQRTGLQTVLWRELDMLAFVSGSNYIAFLDGTCPEEYTHDGDDLHVHLKNIGAKKSLTVSDIMHSMAVISGGAGIEALLGGWARSSGFPGGGDTTTIGLERIASLKEKEIKLGMSLVLNGEDRLLAVGNATTRPLEFDGIESQVTAVNGAHANANASGTFDSEEFDRFLAEACAKPTHIFGHPTAIQEMLTDYWANTQGFITYPNGNRLTPGLNFAGYVTTGVGTMTVIADGNFTRTAQGATGNFLSNLYALRMTHNGVPLVYRATQIPLSLQDLTPGCTSIAFEIWKKTALIIKAMCAQNIYSLASFEGRVVTTCTAIG